MEWALLPAWSPYLLAAALMMALALWLAWLDIGSVTHRTFAALLVMRATTMVLYALRGLASTPREEEYFLTLIPYFQLPIGVLSLYFVALYPRPGRWFGRTRWGAASAVAACATLVLAYAWRHEWVYTVGRVEGAIPFFAAGPALSYTTFGPLLALGAQPLAFSIVTLVLALEWRRQPVERPWYSGFLVMAGFALNGLFDGTLQTIALARMVLAGEAAALLPWGWTATLGATALPITVAALAVVALHARSAAGIARRHALRLAWVAPLPVASGIALAFLGPLFINGPIAQFVLGIWRLALPALVTYALVRHQLFDIDVKVKSGIRASAIAAVFLAVFFTVSEVAANFIQDAIGTALGLAAAVVLAFALRPVERFAEGLAHKIMPEVQPIEKMRLDEREKFYLEQVELALMDGNVGAKERAMLDKLRARLGISPEQAGRVERSIAFSRTGAKPAL